VGDDPEKVLRNRSLLRAHLGLDREPFWLRQVHGCTVAGCGSGDQSVEADASVSTNPGHPCAVLTADCLPVLFCNQRANRVAAIHAGWRGLAAGVIEAALDRFDDDGDEILAWLGPAIGPQQFEVGDEVREQFIALDPDHAKSFTAGRSGHWMADIYGLARRRLELREVGFVGGGDYCTVSEADRFFSYRRDGGVTGRMASLIWLEA
jgi:YfiH family protein